MHLTRYTDFALRTLIHLAVHDERLCSIAEIASANGISQNHLMKVASDLSRAGYVAAVRGRSGGLRLARAPEAINVGEVVRHTEEGFQLADCAHCVIAPACGLSHVLDEALAAFLNILDGYTLADLLTKRRALRRILGGERSPA
ncbi:MAG: Rrf2 family transcriptional regulator [Alphaproteobacteria bacterium]|nr:Rrf2 family transcriptional regulator [Alphaproteobacteria bacterium]